MMSPSGEWKRVDRPSQASTRAGELRALERSLLGVALLVLASCDRAPARPSAATAPPVAKPSPSTAVEPSFTSRWVYPVPQGNSLAAAWLSPHGDVIAVGEGGTVVRWAAGERSFDTRQLGAADLWAIGGNDEGVYAAGESGALFVSRDRGRGWKRVESGSNAHWRALAGCGRELWAVGSDGQFSRSVDAGNTWQAGRVPNAPEPRSTPSVPHGPHDLTGVVCEAGARVTAIVHSGAVLRSADGGASWKRDDFAPAQLGSVAHPDRVHGLAFVKLLRARNELLVVSLVGVPASEEKLPAKRWAHVLSVHDQQVKPWRVAQQLEQEVDRGFDAAPIGARSLVVTSSLHAALVTDSGNYWAGPGDASWQRAALNPDQQQIGMESEPMADVIGDERLLYAVGAWGSILQSTDAGRHWQRLRSPVDRFRAVWTNGADALAAGQGVAVSSDGGSTWSAPKKVAGKDLLGARAVWGVGDERYIAADAGLFHSADRGASFALVPQELGGRLRAAGVWGTAKGSALVVGSAHDARGAARAGVVLRGSGLRFEVVLEQAPVPTAGFPRVFTALHGNGEGHVYAGGVAGIFLRSRDAGSTWERLPALGEKDEVCGLHAGRGDAVWVLTGGLGCKATRLLASSDGGKTFTELASPHEGAPVSAIGGSAMGELVVATAGRVYEQRAGASGFTELTVGAHAASTPLLAIAAAAPRRLLAVGDHGTILLVGPEP